MTLGLKEAELQKSVLTNRNRIQRLLWLGKQAHLCDARRMPKVVVVDPVDIDRKNRLLPGEISECV